MINLEKWMASWHSFWKGLYAAVHILDARQKFVHEEGCNIENGFQVFNTYRVGYHFNLFKDRFFIQPSFAVTHPPYHTNMSEAFQQIGDKWQNISLVNRDCILDSIFSILAVNKLIG